MEKKSNRNIYILSTAVIMVTLALFYVSYGDFFKISRASSNFTKEVDKLNISYTSTNYVNFIEAKPVTEEDVVDLAGYTFTVKNISDEITPFRIELNNNEYFYLEGYETNDCFNNYAFEKCDKYRATRNAENSVSRDFIRYQLESEGVIVGDGLLGCTTDSALKGNFECLENDEIYNGILNAGQSATFIVRVWLMSSDNEYIITNTKNKNIGLIINVVNKGSIDSEYEPSTNIPRGTMSDY